MIKNLKIAYKLTLLVAIILSFIGLVGWTAMKTIKDADAALATIYHDRVEALGQLKEISDGYSVDIVDAIHKLRLKAMNKERALELIKGAVDSIDKNWAAYLDTYLNDEETAMVVTIKTEKVESDKAIKELLGIVERGRPEELSAFVETKLYQKLTPVADEISKLSDLQIRVAKQVFEQQLIVSSNGHKVMIGLILSAIMMSIALSYYIIRMITVPLNYANRAITQMAVGNLDVDIVDAGIHDEVGMIITSTAAIAQTLKAVSQDLNLQITAAKDGALSVRADSSIHPGSFGEIVEGVNALFDTLTEPMTEIASVMAKLASGDIRGRINGDYQGELRALKGNVNRSLDALVTLLDAISAFSSALAIGDLTKSVDGAFQGEFASIKQNLNSAAEQLRNVLISVIETTTNVSVSAAQTTAASSEVSRHASSQMLTLTDVSGAIEQTVSAIAEIAQAADRGSNLARNAVNAAESGQTTLINLTDAVHNVASKNKRITQISDLIENIADKTYVLALNAGLEALRAGDHGAGFGLIAHKITSLAEEVAEATRSIKQLIGEATDSVQQGVDGSIEAQSSIKSIVELSQQNGLNVQAIAASIEEQSSMMKMLKERVEELKLVGNTTASAAEEISMTMKALESMTQQLKSSTDQIKAK